MPLCGGLTVCFAELKFMLDMVILRRVVLYHIIICYGIGIGIPVTGRGGGSKRDGAEVDRNHILPICKNRQ